VRRDLLNQAHKPRVAYWIHSPTPYFVERFNALAQSDAFDFEAWFNDRRESHRSWNVDEADWRFQARYIPRRRLVGWCERVPVPELRSVQPDLLVQECDRSHLFAGFCAAKHLAGRTTLRALPSYDSWSDRTWWRERGKHLVFRAADGAKVPGPDGMQLARKYGLDADRIYSVTQSIDVAHYAGALAVSAAARDERRAEFGLQGCVFLYVGRLWNGKGVDDLLAAYASVVAANQDVSLLLIGDGPDEERYKRLAAGLPRVWFAGFVQTADLPTFYALADALVFPTHGDPNGLVVEEAMAAGLPVITTSAAGDIRRRVPEGRAGYVVEPSRPAQLGAVMLRVAESPRLRRQLAAGASHAVTERSHERYVQDFERFVDRVLAQPSRRTIAASVCQAIGLFVFFAGRRGACAPLVTAGVSTAING